MRRSRRARHLPQLLLRVLDLLSGVLVGMRLIIDVRRYAVAAIKQNRNDVVRRAALFEKPVDDVPDGARAVAAEVLAAAVLDELVEIVLRLSLCLLLVLGAIEFGERRVEQRIDIGQRRRGDAKLPSRDGDEASALR